MTRTTQVNRSLPVWMRLMVWLVLVSFSTVSVAQAGGALIRDAQGMPMTGYTANGTYVENGRIRGNPHQILHDLVNNALWTTAAWSFSNTTDPSFVHPTLGAMESALTPPPGALSVSVLNIGANPYTGSTLSNAAANSTIYEQAAQEAAAKGYSCSQIWAGGPCQGSLSSIQVGSSPELAMLGASAFLSSPTVTAAQATGGAGAVGTIVSQSPEALAHLSGIRQANAAILGSPIYYTQQKVSLPSLDYGCTGGENCERAPGAYDSFSGIALGQQLTTPSQNSTDLAIGYIQDNGQAYEFQTASNPYFTQWRQQGNLENPNAAPELLGWNLRKAAEQHTLGQKTAAGIDFSSLRDDTGLFMQGFDLLGYAGNAQEKDLLQALKNGSIRPGDPRYEQARALAEDAFRQGWARHVEFETKLVHNRESAHWQAQNLDLSAAGDKELFTKGLNLYCKSCDAKQEEGLHQLAQGQLKEGDAGYEQARELAEQRFKLAYENSLMPPKKKSLLKQIAGLVVAAVAAYFIGPAVSQWMAGLIPGATVEVAGVTVVASSGTTATVGGVIASGIGSTAAAMTSSFLSTTIITGDPKQGLKAAGKALKGGIVTTAINAIVPGLGLQGDTLTSGAVNITASAAGQTAAYGGRFFDNMGTALINAGVTEVSKQASGSIGDTFKNTEAPVKNLLAHAVLGCATGVVKSRGEGQGCAAGAAGAVAGDVAGQRAHEAGMGDGDATLVASVTGGVAAALVGDRDKVSESYGLGASAGENAFTNNRLAHPESINDPKVKEKILSAGRDCPGVASCQAMVAGLDAQIDLLSDEKIDTLCAGRTSCIADRTQERAAYIEARDLATGRLDPESAAVSYINSETNAPYSKGEIAGAVTRIQNGTADPDNPVDAYVRGSLDKKPVMLAAVLGVSIIDGDGGRSKGPPGGGKRPSGMRAAEGGAASGGGVGAAGELTGTRTPINLADDAATIRSLTRENESATTLANNGYKVQQNPATLPNGKNPDYIINGEVFDNYAPSTSSVRNAASEIKGKVERGQTNNVVVNLADTPITPVALKEQLTNYPVPGLKQVIIIDKSGTPTVIKLGGN